VLSTPDAVLGRQLSGPVSIGDGFGPPESAILQFATNNVDNSNAYAIDRDGLLDLNGFSTNGPGTFIFANGEKITLEGGWDNVLTRTEE
jgi:hypothetical protein